MKLEDAKKMYLDGKFLLKSRFMEGNQNHEETLTRCEKYAGWTLPHLFPRDPLNEYDEIQYDYQSLGAQATTHLANKIMMALFQPSQPFFRNELNKQQKKEAVELLGLAEAEIEEILATSERTAMKKFNSSNNRAVLTDAAMLLIITGNVLLQRNKKGMRYWTLRDYQVQRDLDGYVKEIVFRETKQLASLPDNIAKLAYEQGYRDEQDKLSVYTCIKRVGKDRFFVWQELEDIAYVQKQIGYYTEDTLPWFVLTWNLARGKDYGTGLVENYSGAFHELSQLTEALMDLGVLVTDVKTLVNPAGQTDVKEISEASSGAYVSGVESDLFVHSPQVAANAEFLSREIDRITRQIAAAFLMNSAVTRDAERVTAEEIRNQIFELESSLGGVYSRLANELQLPLAKRIMQEVDGVFKEIEPIIITGVEALSRTTDLDRMRLFINDLVLLENIPPAVSDRLDYNGIISMLGAGHQVEYSKFLLDEETAKANQQARAEQEAQAAGAEAAAVEQGKVTVNG
jgi:hypothetical protein